MKLQFIGLQEELLHAAEQLAGQLRISIGADGLPVEVVQRPGKIAVSLEEGRGQIQYEEKIHFFRALGLFVEHAREKDRFELAEHPKFDFNGTMIDCSRNGVMTVATVKQFIRYMAVMGLNGLMLYTEDTFEVKDLPYFGYMRGRYTMEELQALDEYAARFGIEMIPCIQTLGHLQQALKWDYASGIKDHADILLVGEPKTYEFIEQMIATAAKTFRSKRIHIGMDEAFQVGLGTYLRKHGYHNRFELMNGHVAKVLEITKRFGLRPMIWSDMYFNLLANDNQGQLYNVDADFSDENMDKIPQGVDFVYWDYGCGDEKRYEQLYDKHLRFGSLPMFAGGIHMWNSISPNYGKTWKTSHPALIAAKKKGLREVLATAWGDNGNETNHYTILAGLQLFAEHGYAERFDDEHIGKRLAACTGIEGLFKSLTELKYMDEIPGVHEDNHFMASPSKFLLWQDILVGLFDRHIEPVTEAMLQEYYLGMAERWRQVQAQMPAPFDAMFDFYSRLAEVLAAKGTLGIRLKRAYDEKRVDVLRTIAEAELAALTPKVEDLRIAHRALWMRTYKPFGWEVLDIRYGGVLARIRSAKDRIMDYAEGRVTKLEELEEERLTYTMYGTPDSPLDVNGQYHNIATAASFI